MNDPPDWRLEDALRHWINHLSNIQPARAGFRERIAELSRTFYSLPQRTPPQYSFQEWQNVLEQEYALMNDQAYAIMNVYLNSPAQMQHAEVRQIQSAEVRSSLPPVQGYHPTAAALPAPTASLQHHVQQENLLPEHTRAEVRTYKTAENVDLAGQFPVVQAASKKPRSRSRTKSSPESFEL